VDITHNIYTKKIQKKKKATCQGWVVGGWVSKEKESDQHSSSSRLGLARAAKIAVADPLQNWTDQDLIRLISSRDS